ncbi:ribonucleotide reductase [Cyanophage S-RIM32]|uniref:Ribonucleotide reductase n=1 Tax=Cyanophage S-RIM32 TaxID=1278479 RepID=A0A127KLR9_9CAUD|nr:ribonucleotide reductase [Cyanophage S-RIM32]AMO43033.1 ribonucleotide reductase [Cyanophage S-RIM32]
MGMLLKSLGGEYHEYLLGVDFSDRQFRAEFGSEATFPQVALGSLHLGSMKDTLQYMKENGMIQ